MNIEKKGIPVPDFLYEHTYQTSNQPPKMLLRDLPLLEMTQKIGQKHNIDPMVARISCFLYSYAYVNM